MTDDEARAQFSAAMDGDLTPTEQAAFDAYLAGHPKVAKEFDSLRSTLAGAATAHRQVPVPDLIPGVQKKLRQRGRGGLGDGTAHLRGRGFLTPLHLGLVLAGLLLVLWLSARLMLNLAP